jgi:hypothetical protein
MWVKRLLKPGNASWKAYPEFILNNLIGLESFKTNIDTKTNSSNMDPYYWTIVKSWHIVAQKGNTDQDVLDIRRQWLWLNKNIKINKKVIRWKSWKEHGINILHDIINDKGIFLTTTEIFEKYHLKVDFLKYNSLKDAIPIEWREQLKTMKVDRNAISADEPASVIINKQHVPVQLLTNKTIYWELINKIKIAPVTRDKWMQLFELNEDNWKSIFEVAKIIRDTKIRTFQYKLLFNLIPCNLYLYKIGRSNSHKCHYCNMIDNITHYFYECENTKSFWSSFQSWWNNMTNSTITVTLKMAIVGILDKGPKADNLNACLQLARWYIYIEKLNLKTAFLYKFLCLLKYKIKIERNICQRSNQIKHFETIWQSIEEYLD